jgi:hypothetical protein
MTLSFGTSTDNFTRTVNSTTAKFFRKEEPNILQKRRLTAGLLAKGRVTLNEAGDELKWPVRYKRTKPVVIGDVVNLNFPRQNKDKVAKVPWAGLAVTDSIGTDSIGEKEKLLNKGPAAILRQVSLIMERLRDDLKDQFTLELYKDGVANPGRIHGFETLFGRTTTGDNDKAFRPNDTYAGHSTNAGLLGTWSGTWPDGSGDAQYEWWSPIIIGAKLSGWVADTWTASADDQLRYGLFAMERTTYASDMVILARWAYNEFVDLLAAKEQIHVVRGSDQSLLTKMGFGSITAFEGVDITWEEGVAIADSDAIGYGCTWEKMELCSPQSQLFKPAPIDFAIESLSDRYLVRFWGNLKLNPRNMIKFVNTST